MSEENVEIVRDAFEASMRQDWKRAAELIDPNVEMQGTVGGLEEGRVARGLPEVVNSFDAADLEAWEERRLEPQKFLHINDLVVMLLHEYRRGKGSGVEVESDTAVVFTVRDGRERGSNRGQPQLLVSTLEEPSISWSERSGRHDVQEVN